MTHMIQAPEVTPPLRVILFLGLVQLVAIPMLLFGVVRVRTALPIALILFTWQAIQTVRIGTPWERRGLAIFLGLSTSLVAIATLASEPSFYKTGQALVVLLLGWSLPLALLRSRPAEHTEQLPLLSRIQMPFVLAFAAALWLAFRAIGHPVIVDEVLYLLQAQYVLNAPFMRPVDSLFAPFFLLRQSYFVDGYLNGQYPPGWPLVLSFASDFRFLWLIPLTLHLVLVATTYAFGRAIASPKVGVLAAVLLSVNGFALYWSTMFFPHIFVAVLALVSGTLMVSGITAGLRRCLFMWSVAGLLLGFACATRPFTGILLTVTLWLWVLLRQRPKQQTAIAATAAACMGGIAPIAWLAYYNLTTTGSALWFGYDVAQRGLQALGFGPRGEVVYKNGLAVENVHLFDLPNAFAGFAENVHVVITQFWPAYLIFPLLYMSWCAGVKVSGRLIAVFGILPLGYFFYFYGADRFYFELLPFAMVGTAFLMVWLLQSRKPAAFAMIVLLLAAMLHDTAIKGIGRRDEYKVRNPFTSVVELARGQHPKLLVFVRDDFPGTHEPILESLYWYNLKGFPGDVVVARDLGERDCVLKQQFPDHFAILVSTPTGAGSSEVIVPEVKPLACTRS